MQIKSKIANVVALAVLGAGLALAPGSAAGEGAACTGIEVHSGGLIFGDGFESGDLSAWQGPEPSFQATVILDLDLEVRFGAGISGDHVLHVKLLTPKGHHYQTLTVPIAFDAARAGTVRRVEGYPRPLAVRVGTPARGRSGETVVVQQLPVAGSSIVTSGLYGTWTATAYLDNAIDACGPAAGFVITP
jgi:hypothetical protein